jgi:hypothetical protein
MDREAAQCREEEVHPIPSGLELPRERRAKRGLIVNEEQRGRNALSASPLEGSGDQFSHDRA